MVHDWGGMIGMAYAARHPERIARLVVLNTAAFHLPASKPFPWPLWLCRDTPLGAWLVRGLNAFCRGTAPDRLHAPADAARRPRRLPRPLRLVGQPDRRSIRFVQDIPLRPGDRAYDLVTADRRTAWPCSPTCRC